MPKTKHHKNKNSL